MEALVAQDWLAASANQLTYYGLEQLHRHAREDELAVFFRNNHFSTITKHKSELYLLATDVGYLHEADIVWERLNQVYGDSTLCDGAFRTLDLGERAANQARAVAEAAEAAEAAAIAASAAAAEDAAAAARLQPAGGAGGLPHGFPPGQCGHGGGGTPDSDYALALALQNEEDAAAQFAEQQQLRQAQQMQAQEHEAQWRRQQAAQYADEQQRMSAIAANRTHPAPSGQTSARGRRGGRNANGGDGGGDCVLL